MLFFCPGLWEVVRHQQWQGGVWVAAAKQGPHQCSLALGVAAPAVGAACSNPLTWEAAGAEEIKQENIETTNHTCKWMVVLRLVKCWGLHCLWFYVLNLCSPKAEGSASYISPLVSEGQLSSYPRLRLSGQFFLQLWTDILYRSVLWRCQFHLTELRLSPWAHCDVRTLVLTGKGEYMCTQVPYMLLHNASKLKFESFLDSKGQPILFHLLFFIAFLRRLTWLGWRR